jgi:hypothetical protein
LSLILKWKILKTLRKKKKVPGYNRPKIKWWAFRVFPSGYPRIVSKRL